MSLRELPPVESNIARPERFSQTFLHRADVCPRSAFLYVSEGGGAPSHALARGTLFHVFAARAVELMVENDERSIPSDMCRELMESVIAERTDLVVPNEERDALRGMAWNFGHWMLIDPDKVVAIEKSLELDLDGVTLSGRLDLALIYPETRHAAINDSKTSFHVPTQTEFEQAWQGLFYSLLLLEGQGDDPVPMGRGVDTVTFSGLYPRYSEPVERTVTYDRQRITEFKHDVRAVIARVEHGLETGEWPAVPGSHCSECSAPQKCPIPAHLLPVSTDEPEVLAEQWLFHSKAAADLKKKAKAAAENRPKRSIPLGRDLEMTFTLREGQRVRDYEALRGALTAAGLDPADYIATTTSSQFDKRKVAS